MKKVSILLLSLIYLISCTTKSEKETAVILEVDDIFRPISEVDSAIFVVLPFKEDYSRIFKNATATELSSDDYEKIDNILEECIINYNKTLLDRNLKPIDLPNYKRQYIPVINSDGEKEVWVNCFCKHISSHFFDWKNQIVIVMDGGKCFFNLKINLTKMQYSDFMVNGEA